MTELKDKVFQLYTDATKLPKNKDTVNLLYYLVGVIDALSYISDTDIPLSLRIKLFVEDNFGDPLKDFVKDFDTKNIKKGE